MQTQELLHRIRSLRNKRELTGATYIARAQNTSCGDDISLYIKCDANGVVEDAAFAGQGCALCLVSADDWCMNARGKNRAEVEKLSAQSVAERLGFDPGPLRSRCTSLVIHAWKKIETVWEV